jgi:glycosyltransferase involved in cell wall biosynthesis
VRVLWLTPELPFFPGGNGAATRQFHPLRRLVELGHEAVVVAPVHASQRDGERLLRDAGVDLRAAHRPASRVREALAALAARPSLAVAPAREPLYAWQVDVFWTALRPLALRALAERPFDVVHVNSDWAAGWARALPGDGPRVLTLENLSPAYYATRARSADGALRRAALRAEAWRWARHDRRHLGDYDLIVTLSTEEPAQVARLTSTRCVTVPAGTDTGTLRCAPPPRDPERPTLLLAGQFGWAPNAEGLLWLLREAWPRIRREVPHARLLVVGANPPEEARRLAGDGVEITGWVDDVVRCFERADLVLVPILSGAGVRLKVLDGLASGRAVVATPEGAHGLALRDGHDLVLAGGAERFAAAAVRLLRDPDERLRIGAQGRRTAEEVYDWDRIGDRLAAEFEGLQ